VAGLGPERSKLLAAELARQGVVLDVTKAWSGADDAGEIRIVELPDHLFFVATLFQPQTRSTGAKPHPLLVGFAAAVTVGRKGQAHPTAE
jgi:CTP synthase (UTP-ammonia lyase)